MGWSGRGGGGLVGSRVWAGGVLGMGVVNQERKVL